MLMKKNLMNGLIKGVGKKTYGKVSNGIFTQLEFLKMLLKVFKNNLEDIKKVEQEISLKKNS